MGSRSDDGVHGDGRVITALQLSNCARPRTTVVFPATLVIPCVVYYVVGAAQGSSSSSSWQRGAACGTVKCHCQTACYQFITSILLTTDAVWCRFGKEQAAE